MESKIIAVCGAPQVGKRTTIEALGRVAGHFSIIRQASETEPNTHLDIVSESIDLHLRARSGSYLHPDSMIPKILTGANKCVETPRGPSKHILFSAVS